MYSSSHVYIYDLVPVPCSNFSFILFTVSLPIVFLDFRFLESISDYTKLSELIYI